MLTMATAKKAGYKLVRGSYSTTTDDRADRWYWEHEDDRVVDRRGPGFATKKEALESLYYVLHINP